jgi:hypothetical protein
MSDANTASVTGDATTQATNTATAADTSAVQGAAAAATEVNKGAVDDASTKTETGEGKDGKADAKAPEKYDLKAPDGIELDTTAVEEFSAIAKELNLTNDQAQKFADVAAKMEQRRAEAHVNTVKEWAEQSKGDKEIGGDAFDANLATARKFMDTFGSPELKQLLDVSGFGNHPEVVKLFVKAGKRFGEDGFVASGNRAATPAQSAAKALYPNMN